MAPWSLVCHASMSRSSESMKLCNCPFALGTTNDHGELGGIATHLVEIDRKTIERWTWLFCTHSTSFLSAREVTDQTCRVSSV